MITMNVNDHIWVKLTDEGKDIVKKYYLSPDYSNSIIS